MSGRPARSLPADGGTAAQQGRLPPRRAGSPGRRRVRTHRRGFAQHLDLVARQLLEDEVERDIGLAVIGAVLPVAWRPRSPSSSDPRSGCRGMPPSARGACTNRARSGHPRRRRVALDAAAPGPPFGIPPAAGGILRLAVAALDLGDGAGRAVGRPPVGWGPALDANPGGPAGVIPRNPIRRPPAFGISGSRAKRDKVYPSLLCCWYVRPDAGR